MFSTAIIVVVAIAAIAATAHAKRGGHRQRTDETILFAPKRPKCRLPNWVAGGPQLFKDQMRKGSKGLTDKVGLHRYHHMYHRYLAPIARRACPEHGGSGPARRIRFLEIGLGCSHNGGMLKGQPGGSAFAWNALFPRSLGFELDLHVLEFDAECARSWGDAHPELATLHHGDQNATSDLDRVFKDSGGEPFDVIVDDGSHINEHQIRSFEHLMMMGYVAKGGVYFIEDIVSSCESWRANVGAQTKELGLQVRGTEGCMETSDGKPTIFAKLVEWQKQLLVRRSPFAGVTHIDVCLEAAAIEKALVRI